MEFTKTKKANTQTAHRFYDWYHESQTVVFRLTLMLWCIYMTWMVLSQHCTWKHTARTTRLYQWLPDLKCYSIMQTQCSVGDLGATYCSNQHQSGHNCVCGTLCFCVTQSGSAHICLLLHSMKRLRCKTSCYTYLSSHDMNLHRPADNQLMLMLEDLTCLISLAVCLTHDSSTRESC